MSKRNVYKVLVVCSEGDSSGAPHVAASIITQLSAQNENIKFDFLCGSSGETYTLLSNYCANVLVIDSLKTSLISILVIPFTVYVLCRYIIAYKIDLVHTHSFVASLAGRLACLLLRKPSIYTIHGWAWRGQHFLVRLYSYIVELIFSLLSNSSVVYVAQAVKKSDPFYLFRRSSFVIVNSAFHMPVISKTTVLTINSITNTKVINIFMIARVCDAKDHETMLRAFSIAYKRCNRLRLILAGNGTDSFLFKSFASSLVNPDELTKIIFSGNVQSPSSLYSISDVVVLASNYEALPLTLIEAMAHQKPIIATDVGGIHELVFDGYNGFLIPPKNAKHLARAILRIVLDPDYQNYLGLNSVKLYESSYSFDQFIQAYERLYLTKLSTCQ